MAVRFRLATQEDIELAISLQNEAFFEDYKRYGVCSSYDRTIGQMKWIINHRFNADTENGIEYYDYLIYQDDLPVGNFILKKRNKEECHVSSLCVVTSRRSLGIGSSALRFIEEKFRSCNKITLETLAEKDENVRFYLKNGFVIINEVISNNIRSYLLEKEIEHY